MDRIEEKGAEESTSPPDKVGDWVVGDELGRGGAGTVHATTNAETGQRGALKLAHVEAGAVRHHWFQREAKLAARLRHPNIVALIEWGLAGDRPFLVYERVEGPALEEVADGMTLAAIVRLGVDLLGALGYAHDAGVVHCDVTPTNVLIAPDGRAMLSDFGLAKARDESRARMMSGHRIVSGTPGYLSPEQARGAGSPGPASDLFGCGALLYRVLTGDAPYRGDSAAVVVQRTLEAPPRPLHPRADLGAPDALTDVVQRLLSRDPGSRYPSAARARLAWTAAAEAAGAHESTSSHASRAPTGLQSMATILVGPETETHAMGGLFSTLRASQESAAHAPSALRTLGLSRPEVVDAVMDRLGEGLGRIVSVMGAPHSGLDDIIPPVWERLHDRGVRVLLGRGRSGGTCAPFESLATIVLDAIGAADLTDLHRGVQLLTERAHKAGVGEVRWGRDALVGGLLGVGPTGAMRTAVMEAFAVCDALLEPDRRPIVIVIADADGVDEGTLEVIRALTKRPGGRVGAVLIRNETTPAEDEARIDVAAPDGVILDAAWRSWSGDAGAGRPKNMGAEDLRVLAALRQDGVQSFDALLASVDAATFSMLRAAAVFGGDVPKRGVVDMATGMTGDAPGDESLARLFNSGVLWEVGGSCARREPWIRMGSPALAGLLHAGLDDVDRRRYLTAAAQWLSRYCLDDSSVNWARVAKLADAAGLAGSAAHALTEAARLELESGRLHAAVPHLDAAVALASGSAADAIDHARAHGWLGEAALAAGRPTDADALIVRALEVIESGRPVLRARLLHCRADAAVQTNEMERALAYMQEGLDALGPEGDPMELARLHSLMGWVLGYRLGRNAEGIAHGQRALDVAARIDAQAFRASLCGRLGANYLRAGDWDGQLETNEKDLALSTAARDSAGIVRAHINIGVCLHNRGFLEVAREHTETALTLAERSGSAGAMQVADNNLAMIALDDGRDEDARRHLQEVFESAERTGYRRALGEARITMARLSTREASFDAAEALLEEAADTSDVADKEMALRAWALLELARGAVDGAQARIFEALAIEAHDPYERALSRIAHAAVLRAAEHEADATAAEREADVVFEELGADAALERRRWGR